jgi:4-amino-4-deoxy-L-arabinose transferase-like glycosyltransferase
VAGIFGFITLTRGWRRWRELHLFSSVAIFLAIAAPWHILAGWRAPGFYWAYFVNENINRALGTRLPKDYSAVPLGLWWVEHIAWLFPWSFFAPLLVAEFPALQTWRQEARPDEQARMLLFVWVGVIFAFFSLEGGSRMEYYSFGAWPALALLLGAGIARAERADNPWLGWIARSLAALGIVLAGAGVYLSAQLPAGGDFASDVNAHGEAFYQSSMAHILDLTPRALADLRAPILIATLSIGGSFVAAWILREWKFQIAATLALAAGMAGFFLAANKAYEQFEPALSSRELAFEINKTLQPTDQIALYGDIRVAPGVAFYSQRRVLLYDATESNLECGSHDPDALKTFFTDQDFPALWQGHTRVFLVVPADKNEEALGKLPKDATWVLAAAGGMSSSTAASCSSTSGGGITSTRETRTVFCTVIRVMTASP